MNARERIPVADEKGLDLDQQAAHTTPDTQDVEREVRDEAQLRRTHAAQRRRSTLQNVMLQWKEAARPEYRPFAEALRAAMGKRGMTASDVAREIWGSTTDRRGYSVAKNRDRIGLYLAATSYPDDENIRELARVLDVPVEELAGKLAQTGVNVDRFNNPRPSRTSGPSITPMPTRPGMFRLQVDQVLEWRLAMQLFEALNKAAEAEALAEEEAEAAITRVEDAVSAVEESTGPKTGGGNEVA